MKLSAHAPYAPPNGNPSVNLKHHRNKMNKSQLQPARLVKLDSIERDDETFQTRHFDALPKHDQYQAEKQSNQQVRELTAELRTLADNPDIDRHKVHLKPIIIWKPQDSPKSIIVNGFHRYDAYKAFNRMQRSKKTKKQSIPARVFEGTEEEAEAFAASMDTMPYLPKSQAQKQNIAWKMIAKGNTATAKLTHLKLATLTGISHSTIRRMRTMAKNIEKGEVKHADNWKQQQFLWSTRLEEATQITFEQDLFPMIQKTAISTLRYIHELLGEHASDTENIKKVLVQVVENTGINSDELDVMLEPTPMDF